MLLGLILPAEHPWRDEAPMVGTVAYDGDVWGLTSASRAHLDLLLLDANDLEPVDLDAIRSYRVARPGTRIVASLPESTQPGSPVLAGLVGMGVYDLTQGLSLQEAVTRAPTYADAVRWTLGDDQNYTTGHRIEVRERIVERRVAGSRRPVLILVVGTGYGAGTTTLARTVAEAAREHGEAVTLIDAAIMPGASRLHGPIRALRAAPSGGHMPSREIEAGLREQAGGYVVVDAGRAGESTGLAEMASSADAVLFAVPPATHRLAWVEALAQELAVPTPTAYVIVGGSETEAAAMKAGLKEAVGDKAAPIHHLSRSRPTDTLSAILGDRLRPVGRRSSMLDRLRWRALTFVAIPGGILELLRTIVAQAAIVVGRLLGLVIVCGALALIVAVVLPTFGGVHAVAHLVAWVEAQYRQFTTSLP